MDERIFDEENGLSYTLHGDYYLPDLELPEEESAAYGKYGMLRKSFLKEHRKGLYTSLLLSKKLTAHLNDLDVVANERQELLVNQMAKRRKVDEKLKAENQMLWVKHMNNIRNAAEEIVLAEIIYR